MPWPRRRPRAALHWEFQPPRRDTFATWALLAPAFALSAHVAWSYADVEARTRIATRALAALPPAVSQPEISYEPKDIDREAAFARKVVTRMSTPWDDLFNALSASQIDEVQLAVLEPDAEARTVRITGEARDVPAMLTYVSRLETQGYFRRVALLEHELRRDPNASGASARGVAPPPSQLARAGLASAVNFIVAASWSTE